MRPFAYHRPENLAQALDTLRDGGSRFRALAGGTTLYDLMKIGVETPAAVVDIHRLPELDHIGVAGGELVIGAGTRMARAAAHPAVVRDFPAVAQSLWRAASQQLRNMATIGGNLLQRTRCTYFRAGAPFPCNKRDPGSGCAALGGRDGGHAVLGGSEDCIATYPGDLAVALIAFDAVVDVEGPAGARTLPIADLHRPPGDTPHLEHTLRPGELITRVRVPASAVARESAFLKVRPRESYAFALAAAAVGVVRGAGGEVRECRIALGGVATVPWRAAEAERAVIGRPLTAAGAREAGGIAMLGARPGRDNAYKVELGARTVADALMSLAEDR
ncbi:FAD binding domain-containing protein [Dactylosporangium sp. CA-139066]|uniref:FAD binding domain-containing protein n=1 Tax=Dactylosporangium sp. CA-139066 TaxID=3239930 RepID=UPI003D8D0C0E